ncbi:MAG TPA: hypothetical protein PLB05_05805, partial [Candidatus Omnitrophota bacterium]|nr:hypothetical protein [Candidatus Omnitrophota bacterium]
GATRRNVRRWLAVWGITHKNFYELRARGDQDEGLSSSSPVNYNVTPAEYQAWMTYNYEKKGQEAAAALNLSYEQQRTRMQGNRLAFVPAKEQELERSIFMSVDLRRDETLRVYARGVQLRILEILGDESKVRLNDVSALHASLVNNLIGDQTLDISDAAIRGVYEQFKDVMAGMQAFPMTVHGPHLMPNFSIILEVRTQAEQVLRIRRAADQILEHTRFPEGTRGFVPDILHISIGYIVDARPEELTRIYDLLQAQRVMMTKPLQVWAKDIQVVKTVNKSMDYTGAQTVTLPESPASSPVQIEAPRQQVFPVFYPAPLTIPAPLMLPWLWLGRAGTSTRWPFGKSPAGPVRGVPQGGTSGLAASLQWGIYAVQAQKVFSAVFRHAWDAVRRIALFVFGHQSQRTKETLRHDVVVRGPPDQGQGYTVPERCGVLALVSSPVDVASLPVVEKPLKPIMPGVKRVLILSPTKRDFGVELIESGVLNILGAYPHIENVTVITHPNKKSIWQGRESRWAGSVYGFDQVDLFTAGVSEKGRVFYSYHHQKLARYLKKNHFDLVLGQLMIEGACQECLGGMTAAKQPAVLYASRQDIETIDNEEVSLLGKHLLYFDGQKLLCVKDSHPHVLNVYSQEAHYAEILGLKTPELNVVPRMTSGLRLSYPERVVVLFNYFSSTERKDFDYAQMNRIVAQLVAQYGHRLAVLLDSGETSAKQEIAGQAWVEINRMIGQHKRAHKGTGRLVIMETYQHDLEGLNKLINSADVIVTPDTYSMHAAVAMGKIVVTPWGYAINRFLRWAPSAEGYLPVMSRVADARLAKKPTVPQDILWQAVEFAVLAALKGKGLDGTTRHERRKGDQAKRGTHPALTVEDLFKDRRVAQGRRVISNILSHRNKMAEKYIKGQANRFFLRTGWQLLAEFEDLKEVLRPQYARLATYHLDTGEDIWARRFALALSGNDADLAQDLLKVSPTVRFAEFVNAYFMIPEREAGSSSSPIEERDAVWDHTWTLEEHEIVSRSFVKVLRDTYGPQVLLEQTRTYAVEDILGPLTEEVAQEFVRRKLGNTLPEALIRHRLLYGWGYPVKGNKYAFVPASQEVRGSSGKDGVVIGEAVLYKGSKENLEYPIVRPEDDFYIRLKKVTRERRYFTSVFTATLAGLSDRDGEYSRLLRIVGVYIRRQVNRRQHYAYRLMEEMADMDDAALNAILRRKTQPYSAETLRQLRQDMKDIFIRALIAGREVSEELAGNERFELLKSVWTILVMNPFGTHAYDFEKIARVYLAAEKTFARAEALENIKEMNLARQKKEDAVKALTSLNTKINSEQQFASMQKAVILDDLLRDTLPKVKNGEGYLTPHAVLARAEGKLRQMVDMFQGKMAESGPSAFLQDMVNKMEEQIEAVQVIRKHLHSRRYAISTTDIPQDIRLKKAEQVARFEKALDKVRTVYVLNRARKASTAQQPVHPDYRRYLDARTPEEAQKVIQGIYEQDEGVKTVFELFLAYAKQRIHEQGLNAEETVSGFLARVTDQDLRERYRESLDFTAIAKIESFETMVFEAAMLLYDELRWGQEQKVDYPTVIVLDESVHLLTLNEFRELKGVYRNIVGYIERGSTPSAHVPRDVDAQGGVAMTGAQMEGVRIEHGDEIVIYGKKGLARAIIKPNVYGRVQAYETRDEMLIMESYYRKTAQAEVVVGNVTFENPADVHDSDRDVLHGGLINAGAKGVGLHRLELVFSEEERDLIQKDEERMAIAFTSILNAEVFSGKEKVETAVLNRWLARLYDVQKDKQPNVLIQFLKQVEEDRGLTVRREVEQDILRNYSGIAFYFYRTETGERPFYEFGLKQLRALFKAYLESDNKRLGISLPNIRNDEVISLEEIQQMLQQAQSQVAAQRMDILRREKTRAVEAAYQAVQDAERAFRDNRDEATNGELEKAVVAAVNAHLEAQEEMNIFIRNAAKLQEEVGKALQGVKIGYYVETVEALAHLDEFAEQADYLNIGTNDMTTSLFRKDYPEIDRNDNRYRAFYSFVQPRLQEAVWLVVQVARLHQKPVLISGEWGSSLHMALYATALALRYGTIVYPVPAVVEAAKQRAFMNQVKAERLTNRNAVRVEDKGVFDDMFELLQKEYGETRTGYKAVLEGDYDGLSAVNRYAAALQEQMEHVKRARIELFQRQGFVSSPVSRREVKDVSSPIEESDEYTMSEKIRHVRQAQAAGLAREARGHESGHIALHVEEAFLFLGEDKGLPVTRGPPSVTLIDSASVTFGVYYDLSEDVLYVETALLRDPDYNFTRLLVRELNAGTERDNISAAARYQYLAFVEFKDEFLNRYIRSLVSGRNESLPLIMMTGYPRKVTVQLEKMLWNQAHVIPFETRNATDGRGGFVEPADIIVFNLDGNDGITAEQLAARLLPLMKPESVALVHSDVFILKMQAQNSRLITQSLTMNVEIERYRSANGSIVKPTFYIHKQSARMLKAFHLGGFFARFQDIHAFFSASRGLASLASMLQALEKMFEEKFDTVMDALALMEGKRKAAFERYQHTRKIMPEVAEEIARTRQEARAALKETFFFNPDLLLTELMVRGLTGEGYRVEHRQSVYRTVYSIPAQENTIRLKLPGALIAAEKPVVPVENETVPAEMMEEPLSEPAEAVAGAGEERAAESEDLTAAKALKAEVENALEAARDELFKAAARLENVDDLPWQEKVAVMR